MRFEATLQEYFLIALLIRSLTILSLSNNQDKIFTIINRLTFTYISKNSDLKTAKQEKETLEAFG